MRHDEEPLTRGRLILVTAGVMLGLFLTALDQTIVGTAMPRIVAELQGLELYSWVLTAYLVASTTTIPIAGKLGDLFGRKNLLVGGMVGFVITSALCGQAQDMPQLIAFRALQGVFGGVLFAMVFASIADLYAPRTRVRIQGLFSGVFGIASVVGPTFGGYLTDGLGWRWIFYVNLPLGLAAALFVYLTMPAVRTKATWRSIDFPGAALLTLGLVPMLVAFSITRDHAWNSPEVLALLGIASVLLVSFFFVERRSDHPIVPFGLFRNRTFSVSVITAFLVAISMFGTIIFVPLLYQGVYGFSPAESGTLLTPLMLGIVAASIVTGQLMARLPSYRYLGTVGITIMSLGLWLLAQATPATETIDIVRNLTLIGIGMGTTFPIYIAAVQSAMPRSVTGVVTSQVQFWRNVGATVGTAILGSILSQQLPARIAERAEALGVEGGSGLIGPIGDAQALFDPVRLQQIPAPLLAAIREALSLTLNDLFIYSLAAALLALVASLFLDHVPLTSHRRDPEETEPAPAFGD